MFLGLSLQAWITIATLAALFVVMVRTSIPAEVTFLGALTILLITGVVTEEEGMAGFASEPVVVHAAFFIVIAGLILADDTCEHSFGTAQRSQRGGNVDRRSEDMGASPQHLTVESAVAT